MNEQAIADALNKISEGFAMLAMAIETPQPQGTAAARPSSEAAAPASPATPGRSVPPAATPAPSFDELPPEEWDEADYEGSQEPQRRRSTTYSGATCPAHGIAWLKGRFGPYCPSQADDPAWANRRGYCSITPKNAAKWVEMQRSAA